MRQLQILVSTISSIFFFCYYNSKIFYQGERREYSEYLVERMRETNLRETDKLCFTEEVRVLREREREREIECSLNYIERSESEIRERSSLRNHYLLHYILMLIIVIGTDSEQL